MTNIFKLIGSIFIDNEKANKSIDATTDKAEKSGTKTSGSFKKIASSAAMVGTAAIAGATALAGAAYSMVTKTADAASAINDSSIKVGMSAEEYQKWAYAAKQSGMEASKLDALMQKQQKTFSDAKTGGKAAGEAYQKLGIDIKSIGSSEEAFNAVMTKLSGMTDETERNAIASKIFGRSYADMNVLLAEGTDGMNAMKQEAVDLGAVMSNDAVAAGDKFGDTIDKLKAAGAGLMNKLGTAIMPILQTLADILIKNLPMIQGLFTQLAPILSELFSKLLPPLLELAQQIFPILVDLIMAILPPVMDIITALLPIITDLIKILLPPIIQIVKLILPLLLSLIEPLLPLLSPILQLLTPLIDLLMMIIEPLVELLNMILPPIIKVITQVIDFAIKPLQKWIGLLAKIIGGVLKGAFGGIKGYVQGAIGVFKGIIDFIKNVFTGNWKGAWQAIKDIFSNIFNGIKAVFKVPINWIIDGLNLFIRGINKIKIPDWVPLVGGKSFHINEIKKLKVGIDYVPFDEMPALLHRGERVLTAQEARAQDAGTTIRGGNQVTQTNNFYNYQARDGFKTLNDLNRRLGLAYGS